MKFPNSKPLTLSARIDRWEEEHPSLSAALGALTVFVGGYALTVLLFALF